MANSRSARKRIRANERKHIRNRSIRTAVRTKITKARRALLGIDVEVETEEQLRVAVSALDRAAAKGVLHPNNASRRKSRLMLMAARLTRAAETGAEGAAAARSAATGGAKGRSAKTSGRTAAKASTRTARTATTPAAKAAAARTAAAKGTATGKGAAKPAASEASPSAQPRKRSGKSAGEG